MNHSQEKVIVNFKKAQTHIAKVLQMLEAHEYCVDIMQQNLAVIGLLKSAHQMLMEDHLHHCFSNAMKTKNEQRKQDMVEEILKVTKIANK
ncbi:MAG: metal-sensitive transcriptional regulator [bacterium]|nr:metal-sensitive transcriptional regulator [bacterium]